MMPDATNKVHQLDPHFKSDIRSDAAASAPQDSKDVYVVLGDQHSHVQLRTEAEFSIAAACGLVSEPH